MIEWGNNGCYLFSSFILLLYFLIIIFSYYINFIIYYYLFSLTGTSINDQCIFTDSSNGYFYLWVLLEATEIFTIFTCCCCSSKLFIRAPNSGRKWRIKPWTERARQHRHQGRRWCGLRSACSTPTTCRFLALWHHRSLQFKIV